MIFFYYICVYFIDIKKVCPAEMPLRRRVSVDSSRGMSEDSSEDEDSRNRNVVANKLKTNRPVEQINVSEINIYKNDHSLECYFFFEILVPERN